jgi:hypothetical protein
MPERKKSRFALSEKAPENSLMTEKDADKKTPLVPERSEVDDSAEMFRGLFTGDEHYHSRGSDFVPLWG